MLQEDSNGDASFEIIDKKIEGTTNNEVTESTSSISGFSSPYSIPSPSGNLLSNVPPPSSLPDITLWPTPTTAVPPTLTPSVKPPTPASAAHPLNQPFPTPQFSAAIPPSKGFQHSSISHQPPPQVEEPTSQIGSGLIGWMKDAVSSGGLLSKVAEKAKSSVDSLITTLDPQMSEFIYSGGDMEVTIASQDPEEINPIRDALYAVFGKAWVIESEIKTEKKASVAVGFDQGFKNAEEKIEISLEKHKTPTIAIENIILQVEESWFDLTVIILKDVERQIILKGFTQSTPIPVDQLLNAAEKDLPKYSASDSVENILIAYLKFKPDWLQSLRGIAKKDTLYLAAKNLIKIYRDKVASN